jgi:hypothetical protein
MKFETTKRNRILLAGALLCTVGLVTAQGASSTIVTFSVDMATNIAAGTFVPGTDVVNVRGTYNGWASAQTPLVQVGSSTVYTNTVDNTTDANGAVMFYIFNINGSTYEQTADFNNRAAKLPTTSGASLVLTTPYFADAGAHVTNNVTFQVDMSQWINIGNFTNNGEQIVEVRGNFNGWTGGANVLSNDTSIHRTNQFGLVTSNVFVGTIAIAASPNAAMDYKFVFDPPTNSYEGVSAANADGGGNRFFIHSGNQVRPIVDYNDSPFAPTAQVTFNVDMTIVALTDTNYNPTSVTINGDLNGWGGTPMTNNPSAPNTNIYSAVFTLGQGQNVNYQYRYTHLSDGSTIYDHANGANGGNNNRFLLVPNQAVYNVPVVTFNDASLNDYLLQPTPVFFSIDMTGAVGTDSHTFDPTQDHVYINGQFANWYAWAGGVNPTPAPPGYEMIEEGTSMIYTNTIVMPAGTTVSFMYKYGMDFPPLVGGPNDDEAGFGQNHYRVVRSTAFNPYVMPQDKFGNQYNEPFFSSSSPGGADLTVGPASHSVDLPLRGTVPVSWLGRPGAHLQVKTNLASSTWQDLPATDGTNWTTGHSSTNGFVSVTNVPVGSPTFFRLIKQ